ncbi:PssE/Cps14G family polysaccharide biosynthesis glycosyltransferase [Fontibacter flavus]|uniref:PssE/Cps14G family polysaccharide biosynthesis glycosyltransferase n=1 Tax=Fontibacter flavus TaxID=654838 RepID=A0ABV6FRP8_9BACT
MILVLLGTFPLKFDRPLFEIENLIKEGVITDQVIVQNGHTQFKSEHMVFKPFLPLEELLELYDKADLIISQAGTGSIIKGLKKNKKIIAIPRLAKYAEVVDDHQTELLKEFADENYLLAWNESDNLRDLLNKVDSFVPEKFESNNREITQYLINYLDSL